MKVRRYQQTEENTILTALIVHSRVLAQVREKASSMKEPFRNRWSNLIAQWCFSHYEKYRKAPGRHIEELFAKYGDKEEDQNAVQLVEKFLGTLSENYEAEAAELNERYILDKASVYFERTQLERMTENISSALERRDLESARRFRDEIQRISFEEQWLNPFSSETIHKTLEQIETEKPLVQFRGDLGRFLSPHLKRDCFVSFAGPEKRGKSFWLMEMAWQALRQRRKVLYYVLGDMSDKQVYERLYARMTLRPAKKQKDGVRWPLSLNQGPKNSKGYPTAQLESEIQFLDPFDQTDIRRSLKKLIAQTASRKNLLRLKCCGASVLSASAIETDVQNLSARGWVPDMVVIDYADLLLPEASTARMDFRHQINESWKIMRRISLDYHLLMVTATQAAASGYDTWLLRKKDFSEDKRKNSHVTGTLGINQTPDEKEAGVYRLNWLFLRDGVWSENQFIWTAGNLALGCPCLRSALL